MEIFLQIKRFLSNEKTAPKSNFNASRNQKIVGSWLLTCSGMVFVAVILGTIGFLVIYFNIHRIMKIIVDITFGK